MAWLPLTPPPNPRSLSKTSQMPLDPELPPLSPFWQLQTSPVATPSLGANVRGSSSASPSFWGGKICQAHVGETPPLLPHLPPTPKGVSLEGKRFQRPTLCQGSLPNKSCGGDLMRGWKAR